MRAALRNAYLSIGEGLRGDTVFIVPIGIQPEQVTTPDNDGAPCERVGDDIASTCVSEKAGITVMKLRTTTNGI